MRIIIIGNSAAGLGGLEAFRETDRDSSVTVITRESKQPYSRVLLPYYLRKKVPYENLFIRDKTYYSRLNAKCVTGEVLQLQPEQQTILLEDGSKLSYDRLLIATGSSPVTPPIPGLSGNDIFHLWSLQDAADLMVHFQKGNDVVILGSGFVSLQGAWAALSRGLNVSIIELMDRIMPSALDESTAGILTDQIRKSGINLRLGTVTEQVEQTDNGKLLLHFRDGNSLITDFIIVGTGVQPNISFIRGCGINIDAGIVVDRQMRTNLPGIYAAGDVAQVPSALGGDPVIHALWPTAVETGRIAGSCMAGEKVSYQGSLNMNVTRMFNTTVASMGKFIAAENRECWTDKSLPEDQSLKIMLEEDVPVGAVCIGSSDLVSTLGMLRPLIRGKVSLRGKPEMLKAILAKNIAQYHRAFGKEY
ncbi:MAG: NAD(P)/FAD-dependent oxidoreductase [Deltaproteobacteria bacterium]|nr:NAD(P)/FAD-dependent oxidoreductase [Deltaproteobacteria bacterium]